MFDLILYRPLGAIIRWCYDLFANYGLAIILFTVIFKILILPFSVKQQKGTIRQMSLRPKEEILRKKYAGDKEKLNVAIMELYKQEGYNPMSGCLPLLIQFPIIIALYNVINRPLTYICGLAEDVIATLATTLGVETIGYYEIELAEAISANMDKVANLLPEGFQVLDFNFLGLNLASTPSLSVINLLWVIPLLSGLTAWLTGYITKKCSPPTPNGENAGKTMQAISPIISLVFCFSMPAGVGFYWTISNVVTVFVTVILNMIYNPMKAYEAARAEIANKVKKKKVAAEALPAEAAPAEEDSEENGKNA